MELSRTQEGRFDKELGEQIQYLAKRYEIEGAITEEAARCVETALAHLKDTAKAITITCATHAHIDMNWLWGFSETASITVDTFHTMLSLLREYPTFTFSQSQASVYHIIETYAPWMLPEIRKYIHEGRWEVTASTWVENDKNMTGTESMARHILYTKKYLSRLLQLNPDDLQVDFEPDTFGHTAHLPEILQQGGIQYYYHCRGYDKEHIYNWEAPSGARVLVYREPDWYNASIAYRPSVSNSPKTLYAMKGENWLERTTRILLYNK